MKRAHNFSAGPAVLPLSVLQELQQALPSFQETQQGLMELSHRSKTFTDVVDKAKDRLSRLLSIPEDYEILFLQGGASLQFYMSTLNLLAPNERADFIMTGTWSVKALKEAKRCSLSEAIWQPKDGIFNRCPKRKEIRPSEDSIYVHYTSNNTIFGTQFAETPLVNKRLVVDVSSDICSRFIDISKHDVVYAGAQKNLGPSGVTVIILSPWAVEKSREVDSIRQGGIPSMLNYGLMVDKKSLFNTPNTFGIYALERMLNWLEDQGGVDEIAKINNRKASLIYNTIDGTDFWTPHAKKGSRSQMNITWRAPTVELENKFLQEADENGLKALKGHRSVGGIRASIYNACGVESVLALVDFMDDFAQKNG